MNDRRTISHTDRCPRRPVQQNSIRPMIRDVPKKTVSTASLPRQLVPGFARETSLFLNGRHGVLQFKQFAQAFGLLAADGDFRFVLVVHFQHVGGLKPRHNFLDVMDVDEEGAVRAPEGIGS
jgi:hypothetical protein